MILNRYIIITPAKNEAQFIEKTINSVINQTVKPLAWIIVDDGSSDSTSEIVKKYTDTYSYIQLVQREKNDSRNFGSKVFAIREGFKEINELEYDFYCNLDADVSFEPNYFETLLKKYDEDPILGICGGRVYDLVDGKFIEQKSSDESVAGSVQFFRKKCYEEIDGYQPSPIGLVDAIAEVTARMKGWETKTFTDVLVKHHRKMSSANNTNYTIALREGRTDYHLGYHPIWHILRSFERIVTAPIILGSILRTFSFAKCYWVKEKRIVDAEFINFIRKEELKKIRVKLKSLFRKP